MFDSVIKKKKNIIIPAHTCGNFIFLPLTVNHPLHRKLLDLATLQQGQHATHTTLDVKTWGQVLQLAIPTDRGSCLRFFLEWNHFKPWLWRHTWGTTSPIIIHYPWKNLKNSALQIGNRIVKPIFSRFQSIRMVEECWSSSTWQIFPTRSHKTLDPKPLKLPRGKTVPWNSPKIAEHFNDWKLEVRKTLEKRFKAV